MADVAGVPLATLVAIAALVVPGAAITSLLGLRGIPRIALLAPASLAFLATLGIGLDAVGLRFGPVSVSVATLALIGAALLVSAVREGGLRPARPGPGTTVALVGIVAGCAAGAIAQLAIDPANLVNQSYDGMFHTNAAISIVTTGDASSLDLYRISNPGVSDNFYPGAWHVLVAVSAGLSGSSVPAAMLGSWVAMVGMAWVPGMLWLADVWFPEDSGRTVHRVAAVLLAATAALVPGLLLAWGTLFPTALAYALLPAGLAVGTLLLRSRTMPWRLLPAAAIWLIAAVLAHPRSLFGGAVILLPLALWRIVDAIQETRRRSPRRALAWLLGLAGGSVLVLVGAGIALYRVLGVAERPISDRLNGGPAVATQGLLESLWQAVALSAPILPDGGATFPQLVAALLTALGLALLLLRRRDRWLVVAWVLLVVLYVLAAGSNSDLAKIATGAWYKDKYRLLALIPLVGIPLAATAAAWIAARIRIRLPRSAPAVVGVLAAAIIAGALPAMTPQLPAAVAHLYRLGPDGTGLLDADDVRLLSRLPTLVPEGERIAGNPWNGAVAAWAVGQREPLFPHFTGVWDADRLTVALALDTASTDPAVCAALDRLDAHYLYESPSKLWGGGDPQEVGYAAMDRAPASPGFVEVARAGDAVLYRIEACDD